MKKTTENIQAILQFLAQNGFAGDVKDLMGPEECDTSFESSMNTDYDETPRDLAAVTQEFDSVAGDLYPGSDDEIMGREQTLQYANPESDKYTLDEPDNLEIMETPIMVMSTKEEPFIVRTERPQAPDGRYIPEGKTLKVYPPGSNMKGKNVHKLKSSAILRGIPTKESTEIFKTIDDKDKFFKFLSAQVKEKSALITKETKTFVHILGQFVAVVNAYQEKQDKYLEYVKSYTNINPLPGSMLTANVTQHTPIDKMQSDQEDIKNLESQLENLSTQYTLMSTEANRTLKDLYAHFSNLFELTNQMNGFAQNEIHNRIQRNF